MNDNLKPALLNVPVLLIFFTRPDTFKEVFSKVKEARPAQLFLACDGPRNNHSQDIELIEKCKKIAEDIDWDCEVHHNYANENMGCGMRPQTAITWAFETVDRLVVLEDDCVPHESFFPFMEELLEKYKDDERIGMVSGFNHFKEWDCGGYSYCFTKTGAIWGWGTWKRVWEKYDYSLSEVQSAYVQRLLKGQFTFKRAHKMMSRKWLNTFQQIKRGENISYWDSQFGYLKRAQSYLSIVPRVNLICNIGIGSNSTHAQISIKSNWKKGMLHFMPTESIETPLIHPRFIMVDVDYDNKEYAIWGAPNPITHNFKRAIRLLKRIMKVC